MSAYEFISLFVERKKTFLGTLLLVLCITFVFWMTQSSRYRGEVLLSVTRTAVEKSSDYAYDEYYRFQADEKLAETLAQYLESAPGKRMVAERARLSGKGYDQYVGAKLRVAKRGTNGILIQYKSSRHEEAIQLGEALTFAASAYVTSLNEDARDQTWFTVLSENPVIEEVKWSAFHLSLIGVFGGVFLAFWAVLLQFFGEEYQKYVRSQKKPLQEDNN